MLYHLIVKVLQGTGIKLDNTASGLLINNNENSHLFQQPLHVEDGGAAFEGGGNAVLQEDGGGQLDVGGGPRAALLLDLAQASSDLG